MSIQAKPSTSVLFFQGHANKKGYLLRSKGIQNAQGIKEIIRGIC